MTTLNKIRYPSHVLEVFKGSNGDWYWRLTAVNTEIVDDASEGYKKRSAAIRNIAIVLGVAFKDTTLPSRGGFSVELNLLGKIRVTI